MIKAVFFDVDGTLLSHRTHGVPESTRLALSLLQQRNIKIVLATGRHFQELVNLSLAHIPFDFYVLLNGQLCLDKARNFVYGKEISDMDAILPFFRERTIPIQLLELDRVYINCVNEYVRSALHDVSTSVPAIEDYTGSKVYQAIAYVDEKGAMTLRDQLPHCRITRWNDKAIDIIALSEGKVGGIKEYLNRTGLRPDEIMAFGDGENDMEMLKFAGIGVAMGNAVAHARECADYVTSDIDADGIMTALRHYHIL
ncbi:MAG: Cof-type HAD-IIB family hydrolase [Lachnospiraceae bacterium]|nr:Cof-type HAD-IIB family hydrolase [Lachnospiraceae bacterium]